MSIVQDVGTVIHVLRVVKRLSQGDLARLSGVRNSSISNYERGKSIPKFETLQKLADGLGMPLSVVEDAQLFIHRIRSRGGASDEAAEPSRGAFELLAGGDVWGPKSPEALEAEVQLVVSEVGRLASRLTRLLFDLRATAALGAALEGIEDSEGR